MTTRALAPALATALLAAPLAAQRMPVGANRQFELFDLTPVLAAPADGATAATDAAAGRATALRQLCTFVRPLVDPPLGAGDGLEPLGDHAIALLGSAAQCAWFARFVAAATAHRRTILEHQATVLRLDQAQARKLLDPLLAPGAGAPRQRQCALTADAAERLRRAFAAAQIEVVSDFRLANHSLGRAQLDVLRSIPVVRDYERRTAGGQTLAVPVVEDLHPGIAVTITSLRLLDGRIAVRLDHRLTEVDEPIPELEVDVSLRSRIRLQVPHVRTNAGDWTGLVDNGGSVLAVLGERDGSVFAVLLGAAVAGR